jgi:hypothetical protein
LQWQIGENDDKGKITMVNVHAQWQRRKNNGEIKINGREIAMVKGRV